MRLVWVAALFGGIGIADARPPDGYACYPGKARPGEGCACPSEHVSARDGENTAICKRVARPAVTPVKRSLALISHVWQPVALPPLASQAASIRKRDLPLSIPAPVVARTGPTDRELEVLQRQLAATRGPQRLAILDRLVDALEARAFAIPDDAKLRAAVLATSAQLVAEPTFAQYARADHALFRHGSLAQAFGQVADARATFQRVLKDYPRSIHVPEIYLWFGDRAFEGSDLAAARAAFTKAAELADQAGIARIATFARYKLGWVALNEARYLDARQQWEAVVAATTDAQLRRAALADLARVYPEVLPADKVFDYFERLDKPTALERVREVAEGFADRGKGAQARTVFRELVVRETEPVRICEASMGALRGSLQINKRDDIALDLAAFSQVAAAAGEGRCRHDADELLGDVGLAWHREMVKTRGDARDVIDVWRHVLAVATAADRRAAIQQNLGYALWTHAASAGGGRPVDWVATGIALAEVAGHADVAVDAFDNALRAARGTGQALAPMMVATIKGVLGKLGTPRANELRASL